ncbi:MAG TPA: cysteine-rich CWC family protein [Thermodesulfobacteriota bacterium]|nr:cysteine-rich CWC family protein [Thermodesulfobacteriota bacterium]
MAKCPGCGKDFRCEIEAGENWCWCFDVDAPEPPECGAEKCYCEACLKGSDKPLVTELLRRISKDT